MTMAGKFAINVCDGCLRASCGRVTLAGTRDNTRRKWVVT